MRRAAGLLLAVAFCVLVWALLIFAAVQVAHAETAESTAYCLSGTMADGSPVRPRSIAMNIYPLGTRIELTHREGPDGLKRYEVRDRIGSGTQLDFWVPTCSMASAWGRRSVDYRIGWTKRKPHPRVVMRWAPEVGR